MTWIPTAKQERAEADKYYLARCGDAIVELVDLLCDIEFAVKHGHRSVVIRRLVAPLTSIALKRLGYKVRRNNVEQALLCRTTISW